MNIVMMSRLFTQSGVGSHIKDLSKQLRAFGHNVYIVSSQNDHEEFCEREEIDFFSVNFSLSPLKMIKGVRNLVKFLKEKEIDIVHCHHRSCGVYMKIISALTGIPFVWSNHLDDIPSDFLHRTMTFYGYKAICVSSELKGFCCDKLKIPERDIEVIIHGVRPEDYYIDTEYVNAFKKKHNIENEKIIGLFARMAPMKGHSCLLEALSKMPRESLKLTKTVLFGSTGGEYVEQLRSQISFSDLEEYVIFEDFVTPSEALSLSDITVLPSLKEGFGIVSIESFVMQKPHIRTKTAGYEDIHDGCIGIEIGDSDALAAELTLFAEGKDYSGLIANANALLEEKCTLESMTNKILSVYKEAINKTKKTKRGN